MARQGVTPSLTPSSFDTFESRSNLLIYSSTRMALLFTSFHLYYYVRDSSPRRISLTISRTNGPEIRIESGDVSEGLFSATTPGDQRRPRERTRGTRDRHDRLSRWFFIGNRSGRILFTFSPLPLPPPHAFGQRCSHQTRFNPRPVYVCHVAKARITRVSLSSAPFPVLKSEFPKRKQAGGVLFLYISAQTEVPIDNGNEPSAFRIGLL